MPHPPRTPRRVGVAKLNSPYTRLGRPSNLVYHGLIDSGTGSRRGLWTLAQLVTGWGPSTAVRRAITAARGAMGRAKGTAEPAMDEAARDAFPTLLVTAPDGNRARITGIAGDEC